MTLIEKLKLDVDRFAGISCFSEILGGILENVGESATDAQVVAAIRREQAKVGRDVELLERSGNTKFAGIVRAGKIELDFLRLYLRMITG